MENGKGNLNNLEDEIKTFIAILLLSGYCKAPYRDLYWVATPNTHNEPVSSARTRNKFLEILSSLHPVDNTQITENRYHKVRVLFEKLNFNFKQYGSFINHRADEKIIPYYGKHSTKQFIRGKAIRFGFKLWWITSSKRYLFHENHTVE